MNLDFQVCKMGMSTPASLRFEWIVRCPVGWYLAIVGLREAVSIAIRGILPSRSVLSSPLLMSASKRLDPHKH